MKRGLRATSRHWQRLGETDPLWAVYVAPGTAGQAWDEEKFLATGRAEIERVLPAVAKLGLPRARGTALDFGCGVGRLSRPLADHFERVIAVDVSRSMLDRARLLPGGTERVEYVLNERDDLAFVASGSVDLVYSSLVLQHLPRALAAGYLAEFVRVLAPGGVGVVQVATSPTASLKGWVARLLPVACTGFLQTRFLRYPAPMRMQALPARWMHKRITAVGGRIIEHADDATYGGHWVYTRYVIQRAD